jgi:hypothetical protein
VKGLPIKDVPIQRSDSYNERHSVLSLEGEGNIEWHPVPY